MNWFKRSNQTIHADSDLTTSILYNEDTFYNQFVNDLLKAKEEVIIESPYITQKRLDKLKPIFEKLINKNIRIFVITKAPQEDDAVMAEQSEAGICYFETVGLQVLLVKGGHHRKLSMIDRTILWEGSLNILSQSSSREFMRRIESRRLTEELFHFLQFDKIGEFKNEMEVV